VPRESRSDSRESRSGPPAGADAAAETAAAAGAEYSRLVERPCLDLRRAWTGSVLRVDAAAAVRPVVDGGGARAMVITTSTYNSQPSVCVLGRCVVRLWTEASPEA